MKAKKYQQIRPKRSQKKVYDKMVLAVMQEINEKGEKANGTTKGSSTSLQS